MVGMTICFGPADRLRGGLAELLGSIGEAESHFRAAMALADRSASPVWRAQVQHDWALPGRWRNGVCGTGDGRQALRRRRWPSA